MPKHRLIDIRGQQFGELTVLRREGTVHGHMATWRCRCSCGEEVVIRGDRLRQGRSKTCRRNGHSWSRVLADRRPASSPQFVSERQSWNNMRERCANPRHYKYRLYGARGIAVCDRWGSFAAFLEDMGPKPTPKHTIDRRDNDLGYAPSNCRWATRKEQTRNMRTNIFIEIDGKRRLLVEVCEERGVSRGIVYGRLKNGWDLNAALTVPVSPRIDDATSVNPGEVHRLYFVERLNLAQVAERLEISRGRAAYWLDQADEVLGCFG